MPKRNNVSYIKPEEPSFLKKIKQQIGYAEPDTIETKRQELPVDAGGDEDPRDDEKPVIVALKSGDLTEEEFEKEMSGKADLNKRMVFNKPVKKDTEVTPANPLVCSSKKGKDELKDRIKSKKEKVQKVKNSCLLSFNDEDGDDDES